MKRVLNQFLPACFALISINSVAQVTIDTLYFDAGGIDALTYQGATSTNYGTDAETRAYWDYGPPSYATRSYYQIDLSSIPANAVVTKSTINLYATSASNGASHPLWIDRVTSSWAENTVTWATAPSITGTGRITIPDASTTNTGWQSHDITSHVQYSVVNPSLNYGWRIALQSETGTTDIGVSYASSENSTTSHRPYLIVEYRIPEMDTIYLDTDGYDAHVYSGSTGTNYGTSTSAPVNWDYGTTSYANRLFLQGDLSNIPRNAVVTNAYLYLYAEAVDNSVNHPLLVQGVTAGWTEGAITWANQPAVTTANRSLITHAATSSTGWHAMSIKALAQAAVNVPEKNYGWRVALQSESGTVDNGITYATSENATTSKRPYILVEYQMPIEIDGYVTHCTNGNNDGAISSVTATGGCYSYVSYTWNKLSGGAFTLIESGTSISDAGISGLSDGLYIFEVTDYKGVSGYQYFFVGEEGSTTNVSFAITNTASRAKYIEDTWLLYLPSSGDSTTPGGTSLIAGGVTGVGTTSDGRTLIQYFVDWDPSLDFSSVEQALNYRSTGHYQNTVSDNDAWVSRVIEPWDEDYSTWSFRPDVTPTNRVAIPATTTNGYELKNDTVDILGFIPYWQSNPGENFGFELALQSYSQGDYASRHYSSSDDAGHNLMVSYTVKPKIETVYYDSLGTGNITVNAPAGELPYTYLIGYNQIPSLNDIWNNIKDSIDIDSTVFFRGKSNTRNYTFSDMPAEHYFVAVFDNKGARIFDDEVLLTPELTFIATNHLVYTGGNIQTTAMDPSGEATLDRAVEKNNSVAFEFVVNQLGNMVVGFNNFNDAQADSTHEFEFGIEISNTTKHFQVILGDSVLYEDTVIANDLFRLGKENYDLVVYKNAEEYHRERVVPADDFKVDVVFKNSTGKLTKPVIIGKWPLVKPLKTTVYNTECDAGNGSVRISFSSAFFFAGATLAEYEITDLSTSSIVASGTLSYPSYLTVPLPVGEYMIHLHWSDGTTVMDWYDYFEIGQPIEWLLTNNFFTPLTSSVNTIFTNTVGEEGTAIGQNILQQGIEGWVKFNVGFSYKPPLAGSPPVSPILYANVRMVDESNGQKIRVCVVGMGSGVISKYVAVYNAADVLAAPGIFIGSNDGPLKIELDAANFKVYYNNGVTPIATVVEGTASDYKVDANAFSGNIHDSYASFCYGLSRSEICAHLDYELDGNYYVTNSGRFCFVYNEEYNDPNIKFNIYNQLGNVVADQTDFTLENLIHGENRVVLDLTTNGYCLGTGFFILEVINDKNEKFYLRFYNGHSSCIPSDSSVGLPFGG
ncbi:MAG: DNRLRE domain-containing protein [Bacteroidetes bacterium]|nr:DNRLRE domain-containing protein [Bacteroidota bacterium]